MLIQERMQPMPILAKDQIDQLLADLMTNPSAATLVRDVDGKWTVHDHRTGWTHLATWDQAVRLRGAVAITLDYLDELRAHVANWNGWTRSGQRHRASESERAIIDALIACPAWAPHVPADLMTLAEHERMTRS